MANFDYLNKLFNIFEMHQSVRVIICSSWEIENGNYKMDVPIPVSLDARIFVPTKDVGGNSVRKVSIIKLVEVCRDVA